MKTPREILFKRHESAQPRLDAIRENVVAKHMPANEERLHARDASGPAYVILKLWHELVLPCRRIWLGMAAVWVVILVSSLAGEERGVAMAENAPPPAEVRTALKEQRQMMAQLLDAATPAAATRPRVPGPRSEERQTILIG